MSHLIKIYTVCKFSCFRLWFLKNQYDDEWVPFQGNYVILFLHPISIGINSFMLLCGQILSYKSRLHFGRASSSRKDNRKSL